MNSNFLKILGTLFFSACIGACTTEEFNNDGNPDGNGGESTSPNLEGYADPQGVFIINSGGSPQGNGSLTYIAPDGTVHANVYSQANGSELGDNPRAMSLYNGKLYILCDDTNDSGNGMLIICDAVTLRKEKVFKNSDFRFDVPASTVNESYGIGLRDPGNITVLDERNIFIVDAQGLFRFDSTTGDLFLLEGSYALGNSGRTIETGVSNKKIAQLNGKIYVSTGGYWKTSGVLEYEKGSNSPSRTLEISTKYSNNSGLIVDDELRMWYAVYNRSDLSRSELIQIDTKGSELAASSNLTIQGSLDPGYENTPGVSIGNGYAYFCGNTTQISRYDMTVGKTVKYINATSDESNAVAVSCNPVIGPNNYLYVATNNRKSGEQSINNLLIYDCSTSTPKLLNNISGQTYYVSGIYCMSDFYNIK